MQLVLRDENQGPYLSRVLAYGRTEELLSNEQLGQIKAKAILMSLKFADKFYNKYKMHLLEEAAQDVIGIVSIGLMALSDLSQANAIRLLLTDDGVVKSFQKGWGMLTKVSQHRLHGKSVYGDVDKVLLDQVSSPPDCDEWQGWAYYQEALAEHNRQQSINALLAQFYIVGTFDPMDYINLESTLAEAVLYRIFFDGKKVRQDLKRRMARIELKDEWFNLEFIEQQTKAALAELPNELADAIRLDLGKHFNAALLRTLHFSRSYQELAIQNASPERLERLEYKEGLIGLLGWPIYIDL
ncbi:hypothetical protein H5202_02650 [Shewanella sp. SG41-4]|uniref:cold adaptation protein AtcC n=1 Tax=Shewanella sp. SG41-4 TaxID=2760976 RepID=UPI0015FFF502|nr:hypothetical protein [Shewanella sp. SG41-4]MBB1437586.1 hypothetical protein [Shewanella sp. SG41-4]